MVRSKVKCRAAQESSPADENAVSTTVEKEFAIGLRICGQWCTYSYLECYRMNDLRFRHGVNGSSFWGDFTRSILVFVTDVSGQTYCPETSVTNYQSTLRRIPQEQRSCRKNVSCNICLRFVDELQ